MQLQSAPHLLSLVDLPERVLDAFSGIRLSVGAVELADAFRPDAILCTISSPLDRRTIDDLPPSVRAIATYSVGHDHIDLDAAKARGIAVFNTPGVLGDAVADAAMLLILGAARRVTESINLLRGGSWTGWTPLQLLGTGLAGKTLGILGMGDIGRRIATRARSFGMIIAYHNRSPTTVGEGHYHADATELVASADVLLLAWPSSSRTRRFVSDEILALAKPSMILINIGRGDLVDDAALIAALREGRILAAGLDVFDNEPDLDPGYLELPNAFLLPHIGSSTWEARIAMGQILADSLLAFAAGGEVDNRIA